jgi:hypothetical protein
MSVARMGSVQPPIPSKASGRRSAIAPVREEIVSKIVFICSDMWEPHLRIIREKCFAGPAGSGRKPFLST